MATAELRQRGANANNVAAATTVEGLAPPTVPVVPLIDLHPAYRCVLVATLVLVAVAVVMMVVVYVMVRESLAAGDCPSSTIAAQSSTSASATMHMADAFRKRQASVIGL